MSPLLETIKLKDGKLFNLEFHNQRMNKARKSYFGLISEMDLKDIISIPENKNTGLFRCRITYSKDINKVEFIPHEYRKIESLKLIVDNTIDYQFKYEDRDYLHSLFEKREDADDVLIVKNGCITDSYTANPLFFDGHKWWTPTTPLLAGTQRNKLLMEGKIFECKITPDDLIKYRKVGLINALQDMDEMPIIEIKNIF